MEDLNSSLKQYKDQLSMVNQALDSTAEGNERESLVVLKADLTQLIQLTQESLDVSTRNAVVNNADENNELDDEYALFMQEMAQTGAYDNKEKESLNEAQQNENSNDSDIEDELSSLLGMKCGVYHIHKWGGQPSLYNAMVCATVPRQDGDQFKDLQVRVLFTHPTHAEMLPCPFFLDGECRFSDEQCRYSHGAVFQLSDLKEAIEPNFESIKSGSRVLVKLKPPDDEDIALTKKSSEKYHLWHSAVVNSVDHTNKTCLIKLEHGLKSGEKRKSSSDEFNVLLEDIFPLNAVMDNDSDSDNSLSDTEYPDSKIVRSAEDQNRALLVEKSLQNNTPAMGEWERHTRGIGSKLMLAMGYVPGAGLGAAGGGRVAPVEARALPVGKSLDHCMAISERYTAMDPLKVEQKLKRLQKREEERNKRAYEREKERERRNVFNFLNRALANNGEQDAAAAPSASSVNIKQSSSKDLNIEQFKITEDAKKVERDIIKLTGSLAKYAAGSPAHRNTNLQIAEKNKELDALRHKERQISNEQKHRHSKAKMTVF